MPYFFLAGLMVAQPIDAALRQFEGAAGFPGLGLATSADRAPDHDERRIAVEVDIGPGKRPELLGPGTGEQRHDDIGVQVSVLRSG